MTPAPDPAIPVVLRPHPFAQDPGVVCVRGGRTLQEMLDELAAGQPLATTLRVEVGGREVPPALWSKVRPKAGTAIHVTRMPAGGDSGKKWLRAILMIVVVVVAMWVTGGGAAGLVSSMGLTATQAGALVFMVGNLIVNALVPPPQPKLGGGGLDDAGRLNMLTGSQNNVAPYGPIPVVLGECRVFPPHAAMPYSETLGTVSYQRLMFDLGHDYGGPGDPVYMDVSDIRIGDTPIDQYEGVQYEITRTPTLYTADVSETSVNAAMNDGDSVVRTTAPNVDEISLDVLFAQGLFGMDKKGNLVKATATLVVEYRAVGSGTWLKIPVATVAGGGTSHRLHNGNAGMIGSILSQISVFTPDRKPFATSVAWPVATGQYEVRVTRSGTNWGSAEANSRIGDAQWTVLRSIRKVNPSTTGTVKLAMRIKASEQLNGPLQQLSALVRQKVPVWSGTAWSAPTVSLNPAWVLHWMLTSCRAMGLNVPASKIDLANFKAFADFCTAHDFETRGVLDSKVTARQVIDDLLACALGSLGQADDRFRIVFDQNPTIPSAVFTPLDTRNFSVTRVFTELPHALRVRFKNPAADWQMDEVIVLDDGYSYRGKDARGNASAAPEPTVFETMELRFAADAHQAWRIGRHHFAQAKYRPNVFSFETDIANLCVTRGDLVLAANDVTDWGVGWGQITGIAGSTITLSERIELQAATAYSARIRKADGSSVVVALTGTVAGETQAFTLASVPAGIAVGDVVVIGETTRETQPLLVTGINAMPELAGRLTAVAKDDRVLPFWQNPPATIVSEVSGTTYRDPPPAPNLLVILSAQANDDRNDGGTSDPGVNVVVSPPGGYRRVENYRTLVL